MPVCIAGMHRAHTSMIAKALHACGLSLGPEASLMPATADNPEGYWEDERFVKVNDAILAHFGGTWEKPPVLPPNWLEDPEVLALAKEAKAYAGEEPWGWKDPRNTLLLPFWKSVFPELKVILCLRSPMEVATSLVNRRYGSIPYESGIGLWQAYYANAESVEGALVVHGGAFFADPGAEVERVCGFLGLKTSKEAASVARDDLRRSRPANSEELAKSLPAETKALYERLCERSGFKEAQEPDQGPIGGQIRFLEEAVAFKTRELVELRESMGHLEASKAEYERVGAELMGANQDLQTKLSEMWETLSATRDDRESMRAELGTTHERLGTALTELDQARADLATAKQSYFALADAHRTVLRSLWHRAGQKLRRILGRKG